MVADPNHVNTGLEVKPKGYTAVCLLALITLGTSARFMLTS